MDTPVLLVVFNRPRQTRRSVDRLIEVGAKRVYVAADGARAGHPTDAERCAEVRAIVSELTAVADTTFLFRDRNLGCRDAVAGAIDWFFDNEEAGMILEDDIDADPSFFPFCAELLERYADDERIGIISGCNFVTRQVETGDSYFFIRNMLMWGWASWRRAWRAVDMDMADWRAHRNAAFIQTLYGASWATRQCWERTFDSVVPPKNVDTWDFQVCHALWQRGMLAITPEVSLIDNDGTGPDATHALGEKPQVLIDNPKQAIRFPLRHPAEVRLHPTADGFIDRELFRVTPARGRRTFVKLQLRKLRRAVFGQ